MIEAAIWALIVALLFAIPFVQVIGAIRLYWTARATGLKAVHVRSNDGAVKGQLKKLFRAAKAGEEILMVGRTHLNLLAENEAEVRKTLERGVALRILLLDNRALTDPEPGPRIVDLRALRVPGAHGEILRDLGEAHRRLRTLREHCRTTKAAGSLFVYHTTVVVQSSVVIHVPSKDGARMRLLYDLSFGQEPSEKFIQCYKSRRRKRSSDFCNHIRKFYTDMFDPDISSLVYELSYIPSEEADQVTKLEQHALQRMKTIVDGHPEAEAIRDNALIKILPAAAEVFKSLSQNSPTPAPLSAQVELTNECTTHCAHCFRWSPSQAPRMDSALAMQLLDDLADLGVRTITFSGGEPTKHPDFAEILGHARKEKKNPAVGVLSNGVGISDKDLQTIHDYAQWLRLSIDGSTPAVYGRVRSLPSGAQDAFQEVESTIQRWKGMNRVAVRCKLAICYTIQQNNAEDVLDMIRWVQTQGLGDDCLTFKFAHGTGGFLCTETQMLKLKREVLNEGSEFADAANIPYLRWFLKRQSSMADVVRGRPSESLYLQQPTRCFTPHLFTLIDPQGDVYPCCFLFEDNKGYSQSVQATRRDHCIGRVGPQRRFRDIWEGAEYRLVRDGLAHIDPKSQTYKACGECTRHCSHNKWLTQLYTDYAGLRAVNGDADAVMHQLTEKLASEDVWL